MLRIAGTQFTLDKNTFEIYISGCYHRCSEHCHNKELWEHTVGIEYSHTYFTNIKTKIKEFDKLIHKIAIFGGEPLDQPMNEFISFMKDMKSLNKEIWLFTSYELIQVPDDVMKLCDYIKTGWYDISKKNQIESYGYILQSTNQKIWKI